MFLRSWTSPTVRNMPALDACNLIAHSAYIFLDSWHRFTCMIVGSIVHVKFERTARNNNRSNDSCCLYADHLWDPQWRDTKVMVLPQHAQNRWRAQPSRIYHPHPAKNLWILQKHILMYRAWTLKTAKEQQTIQPRILTILTGNDADVNHHDDQWPWKLFSRYCSRQLGKDLLFAVHHLNSRLYLGSWTSTWKLSL